jgi:glycosyltransferase involved in cell wall biosynthesis
VRILSLAPTSFFNDYGCHVRILEEARALQQLGHDVTVVTYFKGQDVPGLKVIRTAPTPWHRDYEVGSSRHKFAFDALLAIRLMRVLARNKFDVIHAHLHEGALIGAVIGGMFRVPVCFDFQGSLSDEMLMHRFVKRGSWAHRFFARLERRINRMPGAIVTSTRHAADSLRAELGGRVPVTALMDGVNPDFCRPDAITDEARRNMRAGLGFGPSDVVVVFLGLLAEHQGIRNLLDAAAILKAEGLTHIKWAVMGYPGVPIWQAQASALGLDGTVAFTGRVPYLQMPAMLALGDIAAAPKLSMTEGSGKILNYMAMGLPVVAFETPAQRELLGPLGVYAPVGDSAALARSIADLSVRPARRAELGAQLRQRATQHFGWERGGAILDEVYRALTGRRSDRSPTSRVSDLSAPARPEEH